MPLKTLRNGKRYGTAAKSVVLHKSERPQYSKFLRPSVLPQRSIIANDLWSSVPAGNSRLHAQTFTVGHGRNLPRRKLPATSEADVVVRFPSCALDGRQPEHSGSFRVPYVFPRTSNGSKFGFSQRKPVASVVPCISIVVSEAAGAIRSAAESTPSAKVLRPRKNGYRHSFT